MGLKLSVVIPAERRRRERRDPSIPAFAIYCESRVHGSRIGSLPLAVRDDNGN